MGKYPQLEIFPEANGKKVWRREVSEWQRRQLTNDERHHGPICNAPDGIYIVTVSEGTPSERFEMAHRLNMASQGTRSTQCNGFVPTDNYDSAIAVANGRVVGSVIADTGRYINVAKELSANGRSKRSAPVDGRSRPVIFDLWVHPAHRRKGLGQQLLRSMADHFGCAIGQICYRFPISRNAVLLLWSMGLRRVEGCD